MNIDKKNNFWFNYFKNNSTQNDGLIKIVGG